MISFQVENMTSEAALAGMDQEWGPNADLAKANEDEHKERKRQAALAKGDRSNSMRVNPAAAAAQKKLHERVGTALFAAWVAFLLFVLLWMLQAFPRMNGYPLETWVPTRCQHAAFAAENKALCGLE